MAMQRCQSWQRQFVLGLSPLLVGFELLCALVFVPQALRGNSDFRQFYAGAYMVRSGLRHDLYNRQLQQQIENRVVSPFGNQVLPAIHPACEYLLLSPLTVVSYRLAYVAWLVINLGILGWCAQLLPGGGWLKAAMVGGFAPVAIAILQGQDSILFLLILLLSHRTRGEFAAGAMLGLGAFRFHLLLPILLAYLIWQRWKFLAGALSTGGILALMSIAIVGVKESLTYLHLATHGASDVRLGTMVNLLAWFQAFTPIRVALGLLGASALLALVMVRKHTPSLATAVLLVPVFSYHLLAHDFVILLLPVALTLEDGWAAVAQFAAGVFGVFPTLGYLCSPPVLALLVPRRTPAPRAELVLPYPQ